MARLILLSKCHDQRMGLLDRILGREHVDRIRTAASPDEPGGLVPLAETYYKRIDERVHYKLRRKEKPDADGNVPMMCPAVGPNATVECPHKELHNKAPDKPGPVVLKRNLPAVPDKICTQTSVKFACEDGIEQSQLKGPESQGSKWRDQALETRKAPGDPGAFS